MKFRGAQAEFLKAHEHYRLGRVKEALTEYLKSLEVPWSTMKSICAKRSWTKKPSATSSALISLLYQKKLIPDFWRNHFSGLRAALEGAFPPQEIIWTVTGKALKLWRFPYISSLLRYIRQRQRSVFSEIRRGVFPSLNDQQTSSAAPFHSGSFIGSGRWLIPSRFPKRPNRQQVLQYK